MNAQISPSRNLSIVVPTTSEMETGSSAPSSYGASRSAASHEQSDPAGLINSAILSTMREYLPPEDSWRGRTIDRFTGVYSWIDVMEDTTVSNAALQARALATGVLIGKTTVAGVGAYGTVQLALIGGAVAGPVGLAAGALLGIGATTFGTSIAEQVVKGGFGFMSDVLAKLKGALVP